MTRQTPQNRGNTTPTRADPVIYPGWWVVLAAGSGQMLQGGFIFWSMGLYTATFEDVFGAPRAQINLIETFAQQASIAISARSFPACANRAFGRSLSTFPHAAFPA